MHKHILLPTLSIVLITFLGSFMIRKKGLLIVFIGDSITAGAGLGVHDAGSPPSMTAEELRKFKGIGEIGFSNQGVSGFTTVDFLPSAGGSFADVVKAAADLKRKQQGTLLFSIMLGTNDSAIQGPNGSPVSPADYRKNLQTIIDSLLQLYPDAKFVIHRPLWYSPSTYNGSKYLQEGLDRLQSYFPEIDKLVGDYARSLPGHVFAGDREAFGYFKEHYLTDLQTEHGHQGDFYLHPNEKGAATLGRFWANALFKIIK